MDERLIEAAVKRAMRSEFEWGRDDCCLWVCDLIREATGQDLAAPLRGYHSAAGAARKLKAYAGGGLCEAAVRLASEARLKPARLPYRGVLVGVVADLAGPALALFWKDRWIGRTIRGATVLPAHAATVAWRIPPCRLPS